jgi:hypothetical protein
MARGIQPLIQLDATEDRNIYSDNPDARIVAQGTTETLAGLQGDQLQISTNFFGDNVAAYKNFMNERISRL